MCALGCIADQNLSGGLYSLSRGKSLLAKLKQCLTLQTGSKLGVVCVHLKLVASLWRYSFIVTSKKLYFAAARANLVLGHHS